MIDHSSVATEADVEQKVILPLLKDPNYLNIPLNSIKGKTYLAPTDLDKRAGKNNGYFPDFSVWELGFVVVIVEAKAPEVNVETGYREACLYARHINSQYKSNLNPCHFVLSCNGTQLAYGYWDSNDCVIVDAEDLRIGSDKLKKLIEFCGYHILESHAARSLAAVRLRQSTQPYALAGGQSLIYSTKPFNSFAAELAPILRKYFTSTAQNSDPEIYEKGYVGADDITQYDRILESLLKDRLTSRRPLSQELTPSRKKEAHLTKAIETFQNDRPPEGQLQIITGSVGTGKSLFVRRYKELLQPDEQRKLVRWAFINFNNAPEPLDSAQDWLCEQFIKSFYEENSDFDPYANENLSRVFSHELQKRRGIYDEIKKKISKEASEKARIDDLQSWQDDPRRLALGICSHFVGDRRESLVVVMDNVDRLKLDSQLGAFTLSLWFLDQSKAFVILQMRDETYERFKNKKPLDTYKSGIVFHVSPPRFLDVVKRRLELSLDYLAANSASTLEYNLSNGIRIRYPNSMLGEFLKSIYLELFERRQNISRILQALAGRNIREALEMFVSILNSGHLREEAITSTTVGGGGYSITEFRVLRILMRTEYKFFNNNSGFVSNILHFEEDWKQPNNFIIPDILFLLADNRKRRGEIGLEGYFLVASIADELQKRGFVPEDVCGACSWLLKKSLIEADHMNRNEVSAEDSVKITASGFIHLRVLCERLEYIYGVFTVTPIADSKFANELAEYVRTESRMGYLGSHQQIRVVNILYQYLELQYSQLKAAYPEFGGERSGSTFILRQITSAVNYYHNPVANRETVNMLDE